MSASYEQINYALRPGKNIERKMISDVLRRLREFAPLDAYRYVGFGSAYFSDFSLFHKALGVRAMTSIEKDEDNRGRFEFNLPFGCIEMRYGLSTDVLPTLGWRDEAIVWLDYDGKLDGGVLADIQFICAEAKPGSVFFITANAHPDEPIDKRVEVLRQRVGPENVPANVRAPGDLGGWRTAGVCRQIVDATIQSTLRDRNAGATADEELRYEQLFNFRYQDGAKMVTVGGVLYRGDQTHLIAKCAFDDFPYVRKASDAYRIEVPNLTFREMRHLNAQLPDGTGLAAPGVPTQDVETYARVYRHFPAFVDAEV
jgi:hypothetical protein